MDLGHLVLEGSQSVWEMNIDLVSEYIRMVSIKDPAVYAVKSEDGGAWERKLVPLGEGMVPWTRAFDRLERIGFDGPVSVHSEYHDYDFEEIVAQTDEDVDFLRRLVSAE